MKRLCMPRYAGKLRLERPRLGAMCNHKRKGGPKHWACFAQSCVCACHKREAK